MSESDRKTATSNVTNSTKSGATTSSLPHAFDLAISAAAAAGQLDPVAASALLGQSGFLYNTNAYSQLAAAAALGTYGLQGFQLANALNQSASSGQNFHNLATDPIAMAYTQGASAYGLLTANSNQDWWHLAAAEQTRRLQEENRNCNTKFAQNVPTSTATTSATPNPEAKEPQESFSEVLAKLGQGLSTTKISSFNYAPNNLQSKNQINSPDISQTKCTQDDLSKPSRPTSSQSRTNNSTTGFRSPQPKPTNKASPLDSEQELRKGSSNLTTAIIKSGGRGRGRPPKLYSQKMAELNAKMENDNDRLNQLKKQNVSDSKKESIKSLVISSAATNSSGRPLTDSLSTKINSTPESFATRPCSQTKSLEKSNYNGVSGKNVNSLIPGSLKKNKKSLLDRLGLPAVKTVQPDKRLKDSVNSEKNDVNSEIPQRRQATEQSIEVTIDSVLRRFEEDEERNQTMSEANLSKTSIAELNIGKDDSTKKRKQTEKLENNGNFKRSKLNDGASNYNLPLQLGWKRETLVKGVGPGGILGEVVYVAPCGKKLWNMENIRDYLLNYPNSSLCPEDFTFKSYVRIGDYYECNKTNPSRNNYTKMTEESIQELIGAVAGVSNNTSRLEPPPAHSGVKSIICSRAPLPEINRPNSESPHLPDKTSTSEASECRQMEIVEAERQKQYAYLLNSERERQKQNVMFARVIEQQKKLEEKTKQQLHRQQEKLTSKQKKLEQKMIDSRVAQELKRANEDLRLANTKHLTELPTFNKNRMSSQALGDCMMMIEFLNTFSEALWIDPETIPTLGTFQGAMLDCDPVCQDSVSTLLIELLKFAVCDPGIPNPRIVTQMLGLRFSDMQINCDTLSSVLRMFIIARNGLEDDMSDWLSNANSFHDLSADQQAAIISFLCHELLSSRLISGEVDRNIDQQSMLRREKWSIDNKIRKLRNLHGRRFGDFPLNNSESGLPSGGDCSRESVTTGRCNQQNKMELENSCCGGDEESGNESDETHMTSNQSGDEEDNISTAEDLEKKIERLSAQSNSKQSSVVDCGYRLRGIYLGQDRYRRNYFALGNLGGVFVQGLSTDQREDYFDADEFIKDLRKRKEFHAAKRKARNKDFANNSSLKLLASSLAGKDEFLLKNEVTEKSLCSEIKDDIFEPTVSQTEYPTISVKEESVCNEDLAFSDEATAKIETVEELKNEIHDENQELSENNVIQENIEVDEAIVHSQAENVCSESTMSIMEVAPNSIQPHVQTEMNTIPNKDEESLVEEVSPESVNCSEIVENDEQEVEDDSSANQLEMAMSQITNNSEIVENDDVVSLRENETNEIQNSPVNSSTSKSEKQTIEDNNDLTSIKESSESIYSPKSVEEDNEEIADRNELIDSQINAENIPNLEPEADMERSEIHTNDSPENLSGLEMKSDNDDVDESKELSKNIPTLETEMDNENLTHGEESSENMPNLETEQEINNPSLPNSEDLIQLKELSDSIPNLESEQDNDDLKSIRDSFPSLSNSKSDDNDQISQQSDELDYDNGIELANNSESIPDNQETMVQNEELTSSPKHINLQIAENGNQVNAQSQNKNETILQSPCDAIPDQNSNLETIEQTSSSNSPQDNNATDKNPPSDAFQNILTDCIQTCFDQCKLLSRTDVKIEKVLEDCLDLTKKSNLTLKNNLSMKIEQEEPLNLSIKDDNCKTILGGKFVNSMESVEEFSRMISNNEISSPIKPDIKIDEALFSNAAYIYASQASMICPGISISQLQTFYKDELMKAALSYSDSSTIDNLKAWMTYYQTMFNDSAVAPVDFPIDAKMESVNESSAPEPATITEEEIEKIVQKEMISNGYELESVDSISDEFKNKWWRIDSEETLRNLQSNLAQRGIREKNLQKLMHRFEEIILSSISRSSSCQALSFDIPKGSGKLKVRSKRGKARGVNRRESSSILSELSDEYQSDEVFVAECLQLEQVEALEDRVLNASLQTKGWQAPLKIVDDDTIHLVSKVTKKKSRFENYPLDLCKERILSLEQHMERRYLLPPLNKEPHLDIVEGTPDANDGFSRDGSTMNDDKFCDIADALSESCDDTIVSSSSLCNGRSNSHRLKRQETETEDEENLPLGLIQWRESVAKTMTAEQFKSCLDQLIKAVAWDKSIMKVLCQICRKDNNEAQLLLCDGCDRGYHTYCFRPPLTQIPTGDWFCYDCVSKATNKRHCFVCGQTADTSIGQTRGAVCDHCSRMVHMDCIKPPLTRIPRKWLCSVCQEMSTQPTRTSAATASNNILTPANPTSTTVNPPPTPTNSIRKATSNSTKRSRTTTTSSKAAAVPKKSGEACSNSLLINTLPEAKAFSGSEDNLTDTASVGSSCDNTNPPSSKKPRSSMTFDFTEEPWSERDHQVCLRIMSELELHQFSWPFLKPVNSKQVPFYKKVIKTPMDFSTVRKQLTENRYKTKSEFIRDIRLVFDNCEIFNEDDSEVGQCGHKMRVIFEDLWPKIEREVDFISAAESQSSSKPSSENSSVTKSTITNSDEPECKPPPCSNLSSFCHKPRKSFKSCPTSPSLFPNLNDNSSVSSVDKLSKRIPLASTCSIAQRKRSLSPVLPWNNSSN